MEMAAEMEATAKAQAFAHRLVEFADAAACVSFLETRGVDLDRPNADGWSVLMSACACGRDDIVGYVLDRTTNVHCATAANRTTALHLAAISANPLVMQQLLSTPERKEKLRPVADMPNVNGDTPLMMACVAKNDVAARLLVEHLGADAAYGNATGMNALMCAARLSVDSTPDAEAQEQLSRRSLAIVDLLLGCDAPVNITELAAGNSALHFAVMSDNLAVVVRLMDAGAAADASCRNKAGLTALELAKRAKAHPKIVSLLQASREAAEAEAARQRSRIEEDLLALATEETVNRKTKANKSKTKHTRKPKLGNTAQGSVQDENKPVDGDASVKENAVDTDLLASAGPVNTDASQTLDTADTATDDASEWVSVTDRKSRLKARAIKTPTKPTTAASPATSRSTPSKSNNPPKKATPAQPSRPAPRASKRQEASAQMTSPANKESVEAQQTTGGQIAWQQHKTRLSTEGRGGASVRSYEQLNAAFHHAFPMAGELELGVETFLIGSNAADRDLQPDDGLSISQIEVLQEAHWQAYHFLNEKKLDLVRLLEAQRVEAQFALQQEILHLE